METEKVVRYSLTVFVIVLLIIATFSLYMSLNAIIDSFFGYKHGAVFKIILNAGVIILSIYVLSVLKRGS